MFDIVLNASLKILSETFSQLITCMSYRGALAPKIFLNQN